MPPHSHRGKSSSLHCDMQRADRKEWASRHKPTVPWALRTVLNLTPWKLETGTLTPPPSVGATQVIMRVPWKTQGFMQTGEYYLLFLNYPKLSTVFVCIGNIAQEINSFLSYIMYIYIYIYIYKTI
jgi:hypothetical protein